MNPVPVLAAALALSFALTPAGAGTLPRGFDDNPTVVDAVSKAASTGKPVIVYFSEQKCDACSALDGWLVRRDIRQAYGPAYHFSVLFADDLAPQERERWKSTYIPRGAPSWVVLAPDGSYLCTANGGFVNATAALEMHTVLTKAATKVLERKAAATKFVETKVPEAKAADARAVDAKSVMVRSVAPPIRSRPCNASALGV